MQRAVVLFSALCYWRWAFANATESTTEGIQEFVLQMNGYSNNKSDEYVVFLSRAPAAYIVGFEPIASSDRVHHMLIHGCNMPWDRAERWVGSPLCRSGHKMLFAWARNAPGFRMPPGTAFSIGHPGDVIQYLLLQIHYGDSFIGRVRDYSGVRLQLVQARPARLAGVIVFAISAAIPPGQSEFYANFSCVYQGEPDLYPIAFRTHTHEMGRISSGYILHEGQWTLIGKRNPLWPQVMEPITEQLTIKKNDTVAVTCRYDSSLKTYITRMGTEQDDEMCNFYMMYSFDGDQSDLFNGDQSDPFDKNMHCFGQALLKQNIPFPADGRTLLPAKPEWEEDGHQNGRPFGIIERYQDNKIDQLSLGQITGLSFDSNGQLYIFHRASRTWDTQSFDDENRLFDRSPIAEDTLLVVQIWEDTMNLINKYGVNLFYLPQGVFVDGNGDIYTTDVGSHQVGKWKIMNGQLVNVFMLGEKFAPGTTGGGHFCKPTAVTVSEAGGGEIFVADGYCNNRIVRFDRNGKFLSEIQLGVSNSLLMGADPGAITLPQDLVMDKVVSQHLYVADRLNGRVQKLTLEGLLVAEIVYTNITNVQSVDVNDDSIFFVPGESEANPIEIYSALKSQNFVEFSWQPMAKKFKHPNILRVCPNGRSIVLGDAGRLWMFDIQKKRKNADGRKMDRKDWGQLSFSSTQSENAEMNDEINTLPFFAFTVVLLLVLLWRWRMNRAVIAVMHNRKSRYNEFQGDHEESTAFLKRPKSKL